MRPYIYSAKVVYVHKGNECDIVLDLGLRLTMRQKFKLEGLDLPPLRSSSASDRRMAKAAKECFMHLVLNKMVLIESFKTGAEDLPYSCSIFLSDPTERKETIASFEGVDYIDVMKYMRFLAERGFNTEDIDVSSMRFPRREESVRA